MKNQMLGLLVTISYIGLFGCAPSDSSSSKASAALTGPSADLQGTYKISCAVDDDFYKARARSNGERGARARRNTHGFGEKRRRRHASYPQNERLTDENERF